jgi:hypothetical protein
MDTLKKKNPHERDGDIYFNKTLHAYSTEQVPSFRTSTQVASLPFSPFNMNKVAKRCSQSKKYVGKSTTQIKRGWEMARQNGELLHRTIEIGLNKGEAAVDERIEPEFDQFMTWHKKEQENGLEPYRTEMTVYDEELKVAGTVDALFKDSKSQFHMVDWKRCKNINRHAYRNARCKMQGFTHLLDCNYNKYAIQLNIYKYILERNYGIKIATMRIVNFHPNFENYQEYTVPEMRQEVECLLLPGYIRSHREPYPSSDFQPNVDSVNVDQVPETQLKNKKKPRKRGDPSIPVQLACSLSLLRRRRSAQSSK